MSKNNIQGKKQKIQSNQSKKIILNETIRKSVDSSGFKKSRKGTASDTTSSTGPRKNNEGYEK